jgi:glycogen debranching enzyme
VADLCHDAGGSPIGSNAFEVVAAGSAALVAFNARELASVTGDRELADSADAIASLIDQRWRSDVAGWSDAVVVGPPATPGAEVRTVEALLPVLVSSDDAAIAAALDSLLDPAAFGGRYGPTGVHRAEPAFDPGVYWRGATWPQLTYLLWLGARGREHAAADALRDQFRAGAWRSGFSEYWDPDTGRGGGASPQSWTALAAVVD